ncbi:hypothetical protein NQ317_014555 [Molorchus minor]|uniref:OBG-type G domain-containing protein n=1 Tax=Molorchus minor TaxID=1323400 RepID=A0ABQ9JIM0_9CUCU|nr:hypothetical protein NQ317_014555 [Molorchus minor]
MRQIRPVHRSGAWSIICRDLTIATSATLGSLNTKVPAFLNIVDIAGLVKGASEGQGLGNAFLSHISACDAIFHLCRAFDDDDVTHVEGEVNPVRDLDIISEELRLKDEETLTKNLEKLEKVVGRGADKKTEAGDTLFKIKQVLFDEKKT